jgi:MoaA/NifB/PqqE/SkfB family radical SAM enzyme
MEQLRKDLLNGVQNDLCSVCWDQEKTGGKSFRHDYINRFPNVNSKKPVITYIDLKLSNECNLACTHCDYTNSNQIWKDVVKMQSKNMELPPQWDRSPNFESRILEENKEQMLHFTSKKVVDEVINMLPQITHLKVTGGEPTITKEFFSLIDYAISNGYAKNIFLFITTNGTRFTPEFLKKLNSFKELHITVSCDGFGETYEYIRYPFKWKAFEKRMYHIRDYLKEDNHNLKGLSFNCVAQMQNIHNIPKLEEWIFKVFKDNAYFGLQPHLLPLDHTNRVELLPKHFLESALVGIKNSNSKTNYNLSKYIKKLEYLIKNYKEPANSDLKLMKRNLLNLDEIRDQSYQVGLTSNVAEWVDTIKC